MAWEFIVSCFDGQAFPNEGVDVWSHEWKLESENGASVTEPRYSQKFIFNVYQIFSEKTSIRFAAGEFSNNVWGFYREQ